jgi:hypothetical protein
MTSQQCAVECLLNKGGKVLSTMPKNKPTPGPMRTQSIERGSIMPTLPTMPMAGKAKTEPKQKPTRADEIRVAKAKVTRRNSLQKQRDALRG